MRVVHQGVVRLLLEGVDFILFYFVNLPESIARGSIQSPLCPPRT